MEVLTYKEAFNQCKIFLKNQTIKELETWCEENQVSLDLAKKVKKKKHDDLKKWAKANNMDFSLVKRIKSHKSLNMWASYNNISYQFSLRIKNQNYKEVKSCSKTLIKILEIKHKMIVKKQINFEITKKPIIFTLSSKLISHGTEAKPKTTSSS